MRTSLLLAALGVAAFVPFAWAEDSANLTTLFGHPPGEGLEQACFIRHYTKSHMGTHPQQNVTDMIAYVVKPVDAVTVYSVSLGVEFRKMSQKFQVSGTCSTPEDGEKALRCGIECDGGQIGVRVKDETSILVEIPDGARVWDPTNEADVDDNGDPNKYARFGSDDKLFRLDRTDLKDCLPLVWDEDIKKQIISGQ